MNAPFEWAPLFKAEKVNERPGLNERPPQTRTGAFIWKFAMPAEALIQRVCKNDETKVFFSQIFFVLKMKAIIYKWILAICHKQTFYLVFYTFFSLGNDMLTSTYFAIFWWAPRLKWAPLLKGRKLNQSPALIQIITVFTYLNIDALTIDFLKKWKLWSCYHVRATHLRKTRYLLKDFL